LGLLSLIRRRRFGNALAVRRVDPIIHLHGTRDRRRCSACFSGIP
jgi:NAD-dependent SIR2 family protein deacetylase